MAEVLLTVKGKQELEEKLNYLKAVRRAEVSEKIKVARGFGDISENAEYDAAKDEQAEVEGEILEIETKLRTAVVIEDVTDTSVATLGSHVTVKRMDSGSEYEYQIVGTTESDFRENRISNESPLGTAMLGKKIGELAEVEAPRGKYIIKILGVRKG